LNFDRKKSWRKEKPYGAWPKGHALTRIAILGTGGAKCRQPEAPVPQKKLPCHMILVYQNTGILQAKAKKWPKNREANKVYHG
jgi:hypothetical protein